METPGDEWSPVSVRDWATVAEAGIRGQVTAEAGGREISQEAVVKSQAGEAGLLGVNMGKSFCILVIKHSMYYSYL